jgi:hypothetical protein
VGKGQVYRPLTSSFSDDQRTSFMVLKIPKQVVKEHTLKNQYFSNSFVKLTSYLRNFQKPELEVILILKVLINEETEVNLILEPEVLTIYKNCLTVVQISSILISGLEKVMHEHPTRKH